MRAVNTVMMELTWRCGAACSFCYLRGTGRLNARGPELGAAQIERFMRRFPAGTHFYFSGGEPFLRRDIFRILARASRLGFCWGVNTGGLPLTGAAVKRLMGLRPSYVIFSLHGPAAVHDGITGVNGSHDRLLAALRLAAGLKLPGTELMTNCVICPANAASLPAVYLEAARAGADRAVFEHLQFVDAAAAARRGLTAADLITPALARHRMDAAALAASIRRMKALRGAFGTHLELRPDLDARGLDRYYNGSPRPRACAGLEGTINVEPDGAIRSCVLYARHIGSALSFDAAAVRRGQRLLLKDGAPAGCARCCRRYPIQRVF